MELLLCSSTAAWVFYCACALQAFDGPPGGLHLRRHPRPRLKILQQKQRLGLATCQQRSARLRCCCFGAHHQVRHRSAAAARPELQQAFLFPVIFRPRGKMAHWAREHAPWLTCSAKERDHCLLTSLSPNVAIRSVSHPISVSAICQTSSVSTRCTSRAAPVSD